MSLIFYKAASQSNNYFSGALSTTHMPTNTVVIGRHPAAHTLGVHSLYSGIYLKYEASFTSTTVSDAVSTIRTVVTNKEHGLVAGDAVTFSAITGTYVAETGRTVSEVVSPTSFKFVSATSGTTASACTVALTTARTYTNIVISATQPGTRKSTITIGLTGNKNTSLPALVGTSPYNGGAQPTLLAGQTFGSKITVPSAAITTTGSGLVGGEYLPIFVKRIANAYTTYTTTSTNDAALTLSVSADWT
jgi:hypothetical protein